jgi:hypothetical protein
MQGRLGLPAVLDSARDLHTECGRDLLSKSVLLGWAEALCFTFTKEGEHSGPDLRLIEPGHARHDVVLKVGKTFGFGEERHVGLFTPEDRVQTTSPPPASSWLSSRSESATGASGSLSRFTWGREYSEVVRRGLIYDQAMSGADHAGAEQASEFAAAFRSFLEWVHDDARNGRNEVGSLVIGFLGPQRARESVVARGWSPFEHVNLQTALDAWTAREGRSVAVHGIALPPHYGGLSLQQLVSGGALPPIQLSAPPLVDLPNGPGSTLACLRLALLLVHDQAGKYVLMISGPQERDHELRIEAVGLPVAAAQAVIAELDALRAELNVYRRHLLDVVALPMGGFELRFAAVPSTERDDVILPDPVLGRIERHALGVAEHRDALLAAGQHLKRGLLLYGPPGTGKTHTMRYLVAHMPSYTRLVLTGRSLHAVGSVAEMARELAPAVVVLEDVDLVAEDRSFGPGGSPVLFDLLDAMDGAAADSDLLFVLTTNRADLLEPALAARPGRVDVAVEIPLPDASARRRLLELYAHGVPLQLDDHEIDVAVERSDGVTASFLKELLRRAVLESLAEHTPLSTVTATHISRALDDLLESGQEVTRTLLGVGVDPEQLPAGGLGPAPIQVPRPGRAIVTRRTFYRSS